MSLHRQVIQFLKAALECSIYICPNDPGLSYDELVQAAQDADYLDGEIHDAIPQATTLYWGSAGTKILPDKIDLIALNVFGFREDPEYRNPMAFHRVFEEMRLLVRQKGLANAEIERDVLAETCASQQFSVHDVQVAIAILTLSEILEDREGTIRFVRGKETYGSPGDPTNRLVMRDGSQISRPARARAYPIVKRIVAARDQVIAKSATGNAVQDTLALPAQLTNDEWISANKALDLIGHKLSNTFAIWPEQTKRPEFDSYGTNQEQPERLFQAGRGFSSFYHPIRPAGGLTENT